MTLDGPTINWTELAAMLTVFAIFMAGALWIVKAVVQNQLKSFLTELNGRYLSVELAEERHRNLLTMIDGLYHIMDIKRSTSA